MTAVVDLRLVTGQDDGDTTPRAGRPKGLPKTGGRTKGVRNHVSNGTKDDVQAILQRHGPAVVQHIVDIARGRRVRVGPQAGPGVADWTYPTLGERLKAAEVIAKKIMPDLTAGTLETKDTTPGAYSDRHLARAILNAFADSVEANGNSGAPLVPGGDVPDWIRDIAAQDIPGEPSFNLPKTDVELEPFDVVHVDTLPDGRKKFGIVSPRGSIVEYQIGQDVAENRAQELQRALASVPAALPVPHSVGDEIDIDGRAIIRMTDMSGDGRERWQIIRSADGMSMGFHFGRETAEARARALITGRTV